MAVNRQYITEELHKIPMNFIVGKERSGTTLLQGLLNAHPNIIAPPESRFIMLLYFKYGKTEIWTEPIITRFCDDLLQEGLFRNFWEIDKKAVLTTLLAVKDKLTYPLICKIIFRLSAPEKKEALIMVDKNPVYYYFLPQLEKIFPEARYIHLVRDYRANIASHQRVFKIKNSSDLAYRWLKVNEMIEAAKLRNPGKYITLKYESLVDNPESSLMNICSFFEIPFSSNMTSNYLNSLYPSFKKNKRERFKEMHETIFQPINKELKDSWKSTLSSIDIAKAESVADDFANEYYGYSLNTDTKMNLNPLRFFIIKIKYRMIKFTYGIVFRNFSLYYFVRRKIWRDF